MTPGAVPLLVDIGNTRLKWATLRDGLLQAGGVFAHTGRQLGASLLAEWSDLGGVGTVLVGSVVGAAREQELAACVEQRFGIAAEFVRSPTAALAIRNAYADPARLGVDRFLGMAALHAQQPRAQVLVSVGTAMTIDALDAAGNHLGGLIIPSPTLMREAIPGATARVGSAAGAWIALPANTADAVHSGALYAAAGAVDRFCDAVTQRLGVVPARVLTGGGANDLAPLLPDAERAHDLVLVGLALWAADPGARSAAPAAG